MSYTTPPTANRLGYNRGWMFQLIPQNTNMPDTTMMVYLKSYFLLKEYLRFYQINLLSFYTRIVDSNINLIHLLVYKHIRYPRRKTHPIFIDRLNKKGYFKVLNVFEAKHRNITCKSVSFIGQKDIRPNNRIAFFKTPQLINKNKEALYGKSPLNKSLKFNPKALVYFANNQTQKQFMLNQRRGLIFSRHLRNLGLAESVFGASLENIQKQELALCMTSVLKTLNIKKFFDISRPRLKRSSRINKKGKTPVSKKALRLKMVKALLQSKVKTRLLLAKKIMIYWRNIKYNRNNFYRKHFGMKLKLFLDKSLVGNTKKITAIILNQSKKILQNPVSAKKHLFSILGLHSRVELNKPYKSLPIYKYYYYQQNKTNLNSQVLFETNSLKKSICQSKKILPAFLANSLNSRIMSQSFIQNENIKKIGEINNPLVNNQLQLNYLFESYLQNACKISAFVKVSSTSTNVWLKKVYNKFKSKSRLKRAAEGHFFKRLLFAFLNSERYMSPQLVADLIAHELTIPRKHKHLLRNINTLFDAVHSRYILGYKIVVDGKLNGVMKSTKQIIKFKSKDKMPVQEFHTRILYALSVSRTYAGLFGVRVWLYY